MSARLTTETLDVPGIEVVRLKQGRSFAGPYYADQLDLLRDTLRNMANREDYMVFATPHSFWIHRKPVREEAAATKKP